MPSPSTLGSTSASRYFDVPSLDVASLEDFQKILDSGELDLTAFQENMSYLGFDKERIAKLAGKKLGPKLVIKLLYLGTMRGTNLSKILQKSVKVDSDVKSAYDSKKVLAGGRGADDLTMGRLMGTFPEIAAFYAIKYPFGKKVDDVDCPASLQWPAAASLPMSSQIRSQHVAFSIRFSQLIGSTFEPKFYKAAFNGQLSTARLDPSVLLTCGSPTDAESRAVDIDQMILDLEPGGVKLGKRPVDSALRFKPSQVP